MTDSFDPVPRHLLAADGSRWVVWGPAAAALVADGQALARAGDAGVTVLRDSPTRLILHLDIPGGDLPPLVIKTYRPRSAWECLGAGWLRPTPAAAEAAAGRALAAAGFPAARVWAAGTGPGVAGARWSTVVQSLVPGARPLVEVLAAAGPAARRRVWLARWGRLLGELHRGGIVHGDPHSGNFLASEVPGAEQLVPVDLRRALPGHVPLRHERVANLTLVMLTAVRVVSQTDLLRVLRAYLGVDTAVEASAVDRARAAAHARAVRRGWVRELAPAVNAALKRLCRDRGRQLLAGRRRARVVEVGGLHWVVRDGGDGTGVPRGADAPGGAALMALMAAPDGAVARAVAGAAAVLKRGRSSTVVVSGPWVVKVVHQRRWWMSVCDRFRVARARRSLLWSWWLEVLRIPHVPVVAAAERRVAGLVRGGFVVMPWEAGADTLAAVVAAGAARAADALRGVAAAARVLARLHNRGISHRDFKPENLLVGGGADIRLVDYDGLAWRRQISVARAGGDIARFIRGLGRVAADERTAAALFTAAMEAYVAVRPAGRGPELLAAVETSSA